jgi:hypothetical protein
MTDVINVQLHGASGANDEEATDKFICIPARQASISLLASASPGR